MKRFNQLFKKCTNYMQNESKNGSGSSRFASLSILSRQSVFAIVCLLLIGTGQVWADETYTTIYVAISASTMKPSGDCYTMRANYNIGDGGTYRQSTATQDKTKTLNGKLFFSIVINEKYGGVDVLQIQLLNSGVWAAQQQPYSSYTKSSVYSGRVYDYDNNSWSDYPASFDNGYSVYFVNTDSWSTPKAYAFSVCDVNASWAGTPMSSTSKKYNGKFIYKIDYTRKYKNIIFSNNGSNQTEDLTLSDDHEGKMWDGDSWETLQYDVALNQQSGSGGTTSIIATPGSPKPSIATLPTRAGYTFEGYFTSTGGGGTKYYDADGTAVSGNWPAFASAPATLYAYWTTNPGVSLASNVSATTKNTELTLTATPSNTDGTETYQYYYSTNSGSTWNTIGSSTTSATKTYTPTVAGTYLFKVVMSYKSKTYSAQTSSVTIRETYALKIKNSNGWATNIHVWNTSDAEHPKQTYPGEELVSAGGKWFSYTFDSKYNRCKVNSGDDNGVEFDVTGDACVDIGYSNSSWTATSTTCPSTPTVTTEEASLITNTSATFNASGVNDGNDDITGYGFKWGTTNSCANTQTASNLVGSVFSFNKTSLTAGQTIYYKAYVTTGYGGTVEGDIESFVVPYSVTISTNTGCASLSPTAGTQYIKVGDNISATAADGYTFSSWALSDVTLGTPSTTDGVTTSSVTAASDGGTIQPVYTANIYTVTFNAGSGTCGTTSKNVTYDAAYGTLPVATPAGADEFIGWYTTSSGEGTRVTAETVVSTANDHTLYARYESTYEVTVQFKCGDIVLYRQTKVSASASSLAADISAPEILGYNFNNWTGSNATFGDASSATTTVNATAETTITANYTAVPTVYFKNNLGWENVYVSFDAYFNGTGNYDDAPGNRTKPYYQMTQLGSTDIYYCEIPSTYTASNYASWANGIAFDNVNFEGNATSTHTGGMQAFNGGEFTARMDFDPNATMFIPYNGDTETRNGGTFYRTGCWIQYNSNYSGYKVRVNTKVQGGDGSESVAELRSAVAGSTEFTATVNLTSANYTYGVMLYKDYKKNTNDLWYTNVNDEENTITSATTSLPWAFQPCTDSWQRCRVHTEALGDYKFTVSFATGKPMVDIEYPVTVGDWKLIYKDLATWSGDAHDASWSLESRVIKANANAEDTVSFFVSYGSSPSIGLYECTAIDGETGAQTWDQQGSNLNLSSITKAGVYNFKVTQNESKVASAAYEGAYTGEFYIRTDASDGGWSNYKTSGTNTMTYSEYSLTHGGEFGPYSHYYMRFATQGGNIKFCIANDYSECITENFVDDSYTSEWMEANGNVRFMWNQATNKIGRAYISGSSIVSDRFLVLEGDDKMFDAGGSALSISGLNANEMNFTDDQNWIYEATVTAQPEARIKLTAKYNNKIQYFYGAEGDRSDETTDLLIGGSGSDKYTIRIVYDFKSNRLIKAFMPSGDITTALSIEADLMIIREAQGEAQQITFDGGSLSEVKTVYGAMKFNKYTVNNKAKEVGHANLGWSQYKRDLFWISFPFDVNMNDVFGFGEYGKHWIIEYYDGVGRATNGFWADSEPNWKFVTKAMKNSFTLNAFEGYILALDLDEMTEGSSVWDNDVEYVYVYFPSADEVEDIQATNRLIPINQEGYECSINRPTTDGNRTIKDSYWHCIGVPSFANYSRDLSQNDGGATIDWRSTSMPYLYEWNSNDNSLSITSSATFAFKAMYSYLIQYSAPTIYWNQVNAPSSVAARMVETHDKEFRLALIREEEEQDHTYVRLTDDASVSNRFEFNQDLSKEYNGGKANIWTVTADTVEVAGNSMPKPVQTTVVPVGVKVVANGEYTFSMPEGTNGENVVLIDNAYGTRTNLGLMPYTVTLTAGTYDSRFALEFGPVQDAPTGIEQMSTVNYQLSTEEVRKVFVGGRLYIIRDGKVYDAAGQRVE